MVGLLWRGCNGQHTCEHAEGHCRKMRISDFQQRKGVLGCTSPPFGTSSMLVRWTGGARVTARAVSHDSTHSKSSFCGLDVGTLIVPWYQ